MTDEPLDPVKQEREAIARLGFKPDGQMLHRYLRRLLESCRATDESGALLRHEGARILARDLMAIMAEGIESARSGPVPLAPGRRAVSVAGPRGIARRVGPSAEPNTGS